MRLLTYGSVEPTATAGAPWAIRLRQGKTGTFVDSLTAAEARKLARHLEALAAALELRVPVRLPARPSNENGGGR